MIRIGKKVYHTEGIHIVSFAELPQIPRKRCGIAGDINNLPGDESKDFFATSECSPALGGSSTIISNFSRILYFSAGELMNLQFLCCLILHSSAVIRRILRFYFNSRNHEKCVCCQRQGKIPGSRIKVKDTCFPMAEFHLLLIQQPFC